MSYKNPLSVLQRSLEDIASQIQALQEQDNQSVSRWAPEEFEEYFYISTSGTVDRCSFYPTGIFDVHSKLTGNQFETRELAQIQLDCTIKIHTINNYIREQNGDWVADWDDGAQDKWTSSLYRSDLLWEKKSVANYLGFLEACRSQELVMEVAERFVNDILFIQKNYRK